MIEEIISQFTASYEQRHTNAKALKEKGKRIWGYLFASSPVEILSAAGIIPVHLTASLNEEANAKGREYNAIYYCCLTHDWLGQIMSGTYDYLEGIICPDACTSGRSVIEVVAYERKPHFSFPMSYPCSVTPATKEFYVGELGALKNYLEEATGVVISDEALRAAMREHEEKRSLLRRLYALRRRDDFPLTGSQVTEVIKASLVMPIAEYNVLLRKLIDVIETGSWESRRKGIPLMVSSLLIEEGSLLVAMVEELGGDVLTDDFCIGAYCFVDLESPNFNKDPLAALADMYVGKVPIPYKVLIQYRQDLLVSQASQFKLKGVVTLIPRYCQPITLQEPFMDERYKAGGLRTLEVEDGITRAALRTRVSAFLESAAEAPAVQIAR
jgi:benzoyl-CoA reductase/2-hydroxyglutaryl-CoA dehydratase subunit BcrC/BadD/HgdB